MGPFIPPAEATLVTEFSHPNRSLDNFTHASLTFRYIFNEGTKGK